MSDFVIDESRIDECFPMPSYRPHQKEVIQSIVHSINAGYKYVIAECPTGSGKSPIAVTLAQLAQQAYYITTTKLLQDQIEADFPTVVTLKGRNAYPCTVFENFPRQTQMILTKPKWDKRVAEKPGCDEGYCKADQGKSGCKLCLPPMDEREEGMFPDGNAYSFCPYFEQLYRAANHNIASMNFNNFILHLNYGGKFEKRRILIIDEAHNCEEKLLGFLECTVNSHHIDTEIPQLDSAAAYEKWLSGIQAVEILKAKYDEARENLRTKDMSMYENL